MAAYEQDEIFHTDHIDGHHFHNKEVSFKTIDGDKFAHMSRKRPVDKDEFRERISKGSTKDVNTRSRKK